MMTCDADVEYDYDQSVVPRVWSALTTITIMMLSVFWLVMMMDDDGCWFWVVRLGSMIWPQSFVVIDTHPRRCRRHHQRQHHTQPNNGYRDRLHILIRRHHHRHCAYRVTSSAPTLSAPCLSAEARWSRGTHVRRHLLIRTQSSGICLISCGIHHHPHHQNQRQAQFIGLKALPTVSWPQRRLNWGQQITDNANCQREDNGDNSNNEDINKTQTPRIWQNRLWFRTIRPDIVPVQLAFVITIAINSTVVIGLSSLAGRYKTLSALWPHMVIRPCVAIVIMLWPSRQYGLRLWLCLLLSSYYACYYRHMMPIMHNWYSLIWCLLFDSIWLYMMFIWFVYYFVWFHMICIWFLYDVYMILYDCYMIL